MAFRIYLDQTVIRIVDTDGRNEPIQYNPGQVKYYIKEGKFIFYDGIEQQDFNNHGYQDFTDRYDNTFATEADFIRYLNGFIYAPVFSTNPEAAPTINTDEITVNDIDWGASDFTGWEGEPRDLFGETKNGGLYNDSPDQIKSFTLVLWRTKQIRTWGVGTSTGDFSNVKAVLKGSGGFQRGILDASEDPRKKTSLIYKEEQMEFNSVTLEFHTTDRVDVTNLFFKNGFSTRLIGYINKWGINPRIDSNDTADIWGLGDLYIFTETPQPYYISSSSAADTQEISVSLVVLNADGYYQDYTALVTLDGQNKVLIPTPFDCVASNRAFNNTGTPLDGQVYIYEDTDITNGEPDDLSFARSAIRVGVEQTQQAVYTMPHYTEDGRQILWGEIIKWRCQIAKNRVMSCVSQLRVAELGKVARVRSAAAVTNSVAGGEDFGMSTPEICYPGADVFVRVSEVSTNNVAIGANFKINIVTF